MQIAYLFDMFRKINQILSFQKKSVSVFAAFAKNASFKDEMCIGCIVRESKISITFLLLKRKADSTQI